MRALKVTLLAALGALLFEKLISGTIGLYIHERFHVMIGLAAVGLWVVALGAAAGAGGHGHGGHGLSATGALILALPLVLGFVVPNRPLGVADMTGRSVALAGGTFLTTGDSVLAPVGDLSILDWQRKFAAEGPAGLQGRPGKVSGFVVFDQRLPADMFMLSRYVVSCCVADAQPVGLVVRWDEPESLLEGQWVTAEGVMATDEPLGAVVPLLNAVEVVPSELPSQPYLYP